MGITLNLLNPATSYNVPMQLFRTEVWWGCLDSDEQVIEVYQYELRQCVL